MTSSVNSSRTYRSPLRAEQAQETRRRILAAAGELFLTRGYAGTTVAAVAAKAGVSPDTIYGSLGGKRGLLEGVYSTAIFDPEDPEQAEQRRRWESIEQLTDPLEVLRRLVDRSCQRMARTSPVHAIIRGAADGDELAAELKEQMLRRRLEDQALGVQTHLGAALRPGLSLEEACQRYSALASPELYHLTTVDLGWSPQRYESWLFELLTADLLGHGT